MTRRIQIFIEGGFYAPVEFAAMVQTAVESALTDDGEGRDEQPASMEDRRLILQALNAKLMELLP